MSSRAQELADAARKLPSVERAAFLAQACGADHELLDQVKSLLISATDSTDEAQWMKQTRDAGTKPRTPRTPPRTIPASTLPRRQRRRRSLWSAALLSAAT